MRKLQTSDVFAALRIVRSANIADEVKLIAKMAETKDVTLRDVGVEFIVRVIEKLAGTEAEHEFYKCLAGPLEIEPDEIETMDPLDLIDKVMELEKVIDMERLKHFFNHVAKLAEKFG